MPNSVLNVSGMDFVEILFLWSFPSSFSSLRTSAVSELNHDTIIHLRSFDVTEIRLLLKILTDQ